MQQKTIFNKSGTHIVFWVAILLFEGMVEYILNDGFYQQISFANILRYNFLPEVLLTGLVKMPLCYAVAFQIFKRTNRKLIKTFFITFFIILIGIFFHRVIISTWNNNFSLSANSMDKDSIIDALLIYSAFLDNLFVLGLFIGIKYYRMQLKWIMREQSLVKERLEYELIFLKGQINPHFLFNTLNNLFSIAQQCHNHELADGISKLSGMMRYMIYESNAEFVSLQKEIEYINYFIGLNKLRYHSDEVSVEFNYSKIPPSFLIAPMLLIPFVENAFKHGVIIGKHSTINLSIEIRDQIFVFSCLNDVHLNKGSVKEQSTGGLGLENVKRRLSLIYPDNHELVIIRNDVCFSSQLKIVVK